MAEFDLFGHGRIDAISRTTKFALKARDYDHEVIDGMGRHSVSVLV